MRNLKKVEQALQVLDRACFDTDDRFEEDRVDEVDDENEEEDDSK